jgi:hypothetical protein
MPSIESAWESTKDFGKRLAKMYSVVVVPMAIFFVFNMVADEHTRDAEKLGLLWLRFNQASEAERNSKFRLVAANEAEAEMADPDMEE